MYPPYDFGNDYANAHLSKIDQNPEISQKLSNWCADPKKILLFHGNVGTGKTYFCAAWYNSLKERDYQQRKDLKYPFFTFRAFSQHHFFNDLKHVIQMNWNPVDRIKTICETTFLIFDDLKIPMNDWQKEMISELIDLRYSSGLPTLITSNLNRQDFKSKFSDREYDRIFDKRNLIVEQNEESRRQ